MLVPKDYSLDTGNQLIDTCFIIQALGGLFFYHYNGLDARLTSPRNERNLQAGTWWNFLYNLEIETARRRHQHLLSIDKLPNEWRLRRKLLWWLDPGFYFSDKWVMTGLLLNLFHTNGKGTILAAAWASSRLVSLPFTSNKWTFLESWSVRD